MKPITQPLSGVVALVLVVAISLGIISLFEEPVFGSWVTFLFMCCIPAQIVCALVWQCGYPTFAQKLPQPFKGLVFVGISILSGAIVAAAVLMLAGTGQAPGPQLIMYIIMSVVVTFWLVAVWRTWPVSLLSSHPLAMGIGILLFCYAVAYLLFSQLFDYSFMAQAPVYVDALDPKGIFMAPDVLSFFVTTVAVIMFCLLSDFWPISNVSAAQKSPIVFSTLASLFVLAISAIVYVIGTSIQPDKTVYMVRGPVAFVFGAFIVLNLFQNSLFSKITKQPIRGLVLAGLCAVWAVVMQLIYEGLAPMVSGPLTSGLPTYQLELWIANALLGVTFPIIVVFTDLLGHWPLRGGEREQV